MNPAQLLEHFDRISEAQVAVARLRRFVLDLAVRGKLVEQDPSDEPAAELLKRIQAEKAQLVKEGKIKKQAPLPSVEAGDEPFPLPVNWMWCHLGDIGDWGSGSTPPRGNSEYYGGEFTWLKSGELGDSLTLSGSDERVSKLALEKCSFRLNQPGDVLIAMYGATIGKLAILAEPAVTNQAVCGCTPFKGVLNKYLFLFLLSRREDFHDQSEGGAQPNISKVKIISSPFTLPPLAEQHRIVTKVDELMALCDQLEAAQNEREVRRDRLVAASLHRINHSPRPQAGEGPGEREVSVPPLPQTARFHLAHLPRLTTRPEHIKQLRQTILNLAVRGCLVPQDSDDEPAAELLKRISDQKKAIGQAVSKLGNGPGEETPAGWQTVDLSDYALDVCTGPFGSALHQSDYIRGGIPLVNPSHMVNDRIVSDESVSVPTVIAERLSSYRLEPGDIVMARRGEVGRAALVEPHQDGWLCGTGSFYVRFSHEVNRYYFLLLLRSTQLRSYLSGMAVGTTMVNLNHNILNKARLQIPPLAEQHRIVTKVDELMSLCGQLEAQLAATQANSRRLLEAMLRDALEVAA